MATQKLYIGEFYNTGPKHPCLFGKKLLVVGHQKHATTEERRKYASIDDFTYEYEDVEAIMALLNGQWRQWDPRARKSYLQFGRMMIGDKSLTIDVMVDFWKSIAFCNYLQVPDFNLPNRQGNDAYFLYEHSKHIFKNKLLEAQPDKVLVWGIDNPIFDCIKSVLGVETDGKEFQYSLYGQKIDFLNIEHPCRLPKGGYDGIMQTIKEFIKK